MKITFLVLLLAFCLNNLTATSEEETSGGLEEVLPVFAFNREALVKPTETACTQWLELLEIERNKADTLGNFLAFKAFTKEISATIGGKYGFSIPSTHEETIALSYSIIRTRHKFCGKRNMLSDFYGVGAIADDLEIQHYLSLVLAIDTMAAKAINDEDDTFFDQWTAVSQTGSTHDFIEAVRNHTQSQEKASLFTVLDESLTAVLTDRETIATVKDVFDIFAPKITLKKIYTEMIGGEYRGWTIHGADAFAYPMGLSKEDKKTYPNFENETKSIFIGKLSESGDSEYVHCSSSIANEQPETNSGTVFLEYIYDECIDILSQGIFKRVEPKHLFLTKKMAPTMHVLNKYRHIIQKEKLIQIYEFQARINGKIGASRVSKQKINLQDEISFLLRTGDLNAVSNKGLFLFEGENGFEQDMLAGVSYCREAINLGSVVAKRSLPGFLYRYAVHLFKGENGVKQDRAAAVEVCREAKELGNEAATLEFPIFLNEFALFLFEEGANTAQNLPNGIELLREAVGLDCQLAKQNLPVLLYEYAHCLLSGKGGVEKNRVKSIELFKESAAMDLEGAKRNLPQVLYDYAVDLFHGRNGIGKNIPKSIEMYKEAKGLGFEGAKKELPMVLSCYAVWLLEGENSIEQDELKATEIVKEIVQLSNEIEKQNFSDFSSLFYNYSCSFFSEMVLEKIFLRQLNFVKQLRLWGTKMQNKISLIYYLLILDVCLSE